jgi:glycosyltransferase involved in cell wall biosynthesis
MKLEILMSTMNKNNINDLNLKEKNIDMDNDVLIINQTNNNEKYRKDNVRMYNYIEKGISRSRNRAIKNSNGDICIISDDDIVYKNNSFKKIKKAFRENPKADILTFKIETPEGKPFKNYPEKEFWHNKRSILKVSSVEIAFRRKSILKNNIYYDEKFGLGSKYLSGEENIFLMDCLNTGLKLKYVPFSIVHHPLESSGKNIIEFKNIFSKGALFYRLFGWKGLFLNILFAAKKHNIYKEKFGFIEYLKILYKGSFDFIKNKYNKKKEDKK